MCGARRQLGALVIWSALAPMLAIIWASVPAVAANCRPLRSQPSWLALAGLPGRNWRPPGRCPPCRTGRRAMDLAAGGRPPERLGGRAEGRSRWMEGGPPHRLAAVLR